MAFDFLVISDTVRFKVAGTTTDAKGASVPFDFWLEMERLKDADEVKAYWDGIRENSSDKAVIDALAAKARGWDGVKRQGEPVSFSEADFRSLMSVPGLAMLTTTLFLRESGAKEKN